MTTVKFSGGITGISGKVSGNVFGRDRNGNRVRCMARRVKQLTPAQLTRRNAWRTCNAYLRQHADATFLAVWASYATRTPTYNRLGESINLTWYNWFIKINLYRVINNVPILNSPPD